METWSTSIGLDDHGVRNPDFSVFGHQIRGGTYQVKVMEILMALNQGGHWAYNEDTSWYFPRGNHFKTAMGLIKTAGGLRI